MLQETLSELSTGRTDWHRSQIKQERCSEALYRLWPSRCTIDHVYKPICLQTLTDLSQEHEKVVPTGGLSIYIYIYISRSAARNPATVSDQCSSTNTLGRNTPNQGTQIIRAGALSTYTNMVRSSQLTPRNSFAVVVPSVREHRHMTRSSDR